MNANTERSAEKHRRQSLHYLENAQIFLERGDAGKASEFLWGSLSQAIKAVAASRGHQLRTHGDLFKYTQNLAKQMGNEEMFQVFLGAQHLHSNFYESELTVEEVASFVDGIKKTVDTLLSLLPETTQP